MLLLVAALAAWGVLSLTLVIAALNEARGERITIEVKDE